MPNRIETMEQQGQLRRFYIDGHYNPAASEAYRRSKDSCSVFLISERWCVSSSHRIPFRLFFPQQRTRVSIQVVMQR